MRNLKKVLSLTLALVMMLGMMTFAGAAETKKVTAADFKDMDKVVNKEAVTLLVDLGILNGIKAADGTYTFNPAGNIERGAYAKMVYAVKMATDKADVYKGANTGLSDVKGHWAEGYIAYCVSTKIAAGNTNKTFTPNANITVVAAAKMLLTALGYDATLSKYENDPLWAINIMADAQVAGLMNGVNLGADAVLTRDAAAQMIYNALFAEQVRPIIDRDQGIAYLVNYVNRYTEKNKLGEFVFGLKEVVGQVIGTKELPFDKTVTLKDGETQVAPAVYTKGEVTSYDATEAVVLNIKTGVSLMGHEVKYFTDANGKVLSTNLVETGKTKVISQNWTAVSKDDTAFQNDNKIDLTGTQYSASYADAATGSLSAAAGNTVVYINTNGAGAVEYAVVTNYKFAEVLDVNATKGTIKIDSGFGTKNIKDVDGADKLAKGDFVLYHAVGTTFAVEKAPTFAGKITSLKTKGGITSITVGGTAYDVSNSSDVTITNSDAKKAAAIKSIAPKDATEGSFYTDKAGNVVLFISAEAEKTVSKYAYINAIKYTFDGWSATGTVEVKAILADGTKATFTVVDDDTNGANNSSLFETGKTAGATDNGANNNDATKALYGIYKYTINTKGEMVAVVDGSDLETAELDYKSGEPLLTTDTYMDDSTVAVFYKAAAGDDAEVLKSYVGIKNIPSFTNANVLHVMKAAPDTKFVDTIYILADEDGKTTAKQYAYLVEPTEYATTADGYAYNFIVGGANTTLTLAAANKDSANGELANGMYTYTTNDKGVSSVTKVAAYTDGSAAGSISGKVVAIVGNYAIINNGTKDFTCPLNDAVVDDLTSFNKDGVLVPSTGSLTAGATVKVVIDTETNKNNILKAYVIPGKIDVSESTGNHLTATGTKSGKTHTVTAATAAALDNAYTFSYAWTLSAGTAPDTDVFTTPGDVTVTKCVVTVVSRLDGSKCGMAQKELTSAMEVTVSSFGA